ncbi:MAG: glycosyltransferase family 39 protein [Saprospiraceae bacterium]|nr:glycosyltransferase family 39 protein [Candidatus Opimibacter iunctus]
MIFYSQETSIGLLIASLPAIVSVYLYFVADKKNAALILLMLSALLLRLLMISLDPYLHEWDERYHALVAKNMISFPFRPMLVVDPIMPYSYQDWGNNHIWLHKQPLFLWQMAASMKLFGVNVIAMRLPSAIMDTLLVWLTFDICRKWMPNRPETAYVAALLTTCSFYSLELVSGSKSLEHNDIAFVFYTTCALWAWVKYVQGEHKTKWAILTGLFIGLAVLNKWLTGYFVMGGWAIYLMLAYRRQMRLKYILDFTLVLIVSMIVFVPWQLYISNAFPIESAIEYQHNAEHFTKDFGHPGNVWTHFMYLGQTYQEIMLLFSLIGIIAFFRFKEVNKTLGVSFLSMIIALFLFFTFFVKTKMPTYLFPLSPMVFSFMAIGVMTIVEWYSKRRATTTNLHWQRFAFVLILGFVCLKPWDITRKRSAGLEARNIKINNTLIYKHLSDKATKDRVIINCKSYENIELMFFADVNAYHFIAPEIVLDSLQQLGYKFASFEYPEIQKPPAYVYDDPEILILKDQIR